MNVLFVDDDPNVLEGLQRMLRSVRHEWSMHFASSGAAALARLASQPFDVVVSDVKMPGMDGVQLLNEVKPLSRRARDHRHGQRDESLGGAP